jgi:BirA family transcriptional regulator, biotin operon repressor / biotin---[acetyl-CoA-carboxylase] ligase
MLWEGHDAAWWQHTWNAGEVRFLRITESTNDVVAAMATAGAPDFSIALAEAQTRGRGRSGSAWTAAPGSSLLFSVLLRVKAEGSAPGCSPVRIGLAVAEAIGDAQIKWPNDVVIAGHGKVAGVLCEGVFGSHIVAGIGINVFQEAEDFPPGLRGVACSILSATGVRVDRAGLLGRLLDALRAFGAGITEPLTADELRRIAARDVLLDRGVKVEDAGRTLEGTARGVAADGALLLESAQTISRVYNGTVRTGDAGAYPGSRGAT